MAKTLVLGASPNPERYSNIAVHRLVSKGHEVIAVGTRKGSIAGIPILNDQPELKGIDTITLYVNPQRQEQYYDYLLRLKPGRVIFNPGTENPKFINLLKQSSIEPIIACTLVMLSTDQY